MLSFKIQSISINVSKLSVVAPCFHKNFLKNMKKLNFQFGIKSNKRTLTNVVTTTYSVMLIHYNNF
jgi:hypothetical protein